MKPLWVVLYTDYNTTDLLTFLTQISVFDIFVLSSRTRPNVDFFGFQSADWSPISEQCCKPIRKHHFEIHPLFKSRMIALRFATGLWSRNDHFIVKRLNWKYANQSKSSTQNFDQLETSKLPRRSLALLKSIAWPACNEPNKFFHEVEPPNRSLPFLKLKILPFQVGKRPRTYLWSFWSVFSDPVTVPV